MVNPYANFLGERNPRDVIRETASQLKHHAELIGAAGVERKPAPDKWSTREIICHLADCEIAFGFRLRQVLAEPHHVIQPFDQDEWAKPYPSRGFTTALALETFSVARRWNLALLDSLAPEDFQKPATHPERGAMTFQTIVDTMAGHDLNHLGQIEKLAA